MNYGVEESPVGNTCSRGDRVWKPVVRRRSQIQIESLPLQGTHIEGGRIFVQLVTYSDRLMTVTHKHRENQVEKRTTTGIVPDPMFSLASGTCTYKGISDGATLAQVGVVSTIWARVRVPWLQRVDSERYKRDEELDNAV